MEEVDDFDKTLVWAVEEENLRSTRGQGIGSFYLVIVSIFLFVSVFLILYYSNRGKKRTTLDMLRDTDNVFDHFSTEYEEEEEQEVPLIELSEEGQASEEPDVDEYVEPEE